MAGVENRPGGMIDGIIDKGDKINKITFTGFVGAAVAATVIYPPAVGGLVGLAALDGATMIGIKEIKRIRKS